MSDNNSMKPIVVNKFNEEAVRHFREKVLERASIDQNLPIVINIDSYGGQVYSLLGMLDIIEQVPNPIVTVCVGKAMSCGAVLLSAGNYRFCGRNSTVLVHQASGAAFGPVEFLQNDADEVKRLNKIVMKMLAKRCGKTLKDFKEYMKEDLTDLETGDTARDWFIPADRAKEIGLVDYVGMPNIKPHVMYTIEATKPKEYEKAPELDILPDKLEEKVKKTTKKKATKKQTRKKSTKKKTTRRKK